MFGRTLLQAGDIQDRMKQRISWALTWGKTLFLTWFQFHIGRKGLRTEWDGQVGISWMGLHAILGWSFRLLLPIFINTVFTLPSHSWVTTAVELYLGFTAQLAIHHKPFQRFLGT